ncbi:MAG: hypothetical protein IPL56_09210 [Saprospiraceae bacterium]|nr:hypothetical protein [Saprospiraceae bacterium]
MLNDGVIGLPEDPRSNWVSLSGGEGEVTWDKGKDTLMSSVEVRFLQNKAARAWLPTQASLLISVDGQNFKEVKKYPFRAPQQLARFMLLILILAGNPLDLSR